jgi:hypothetical protein
MKQHVNGHALERWRNFMPALTLPDDDMLAYGIDGGQQFV